MAGINGGFLRFSVGDLLELKKKHPCGSRLFRVLRTGSDVRLACAGCGRDLTLSREQIESAMRRVMAAERQETE